jgi:hypothetical protein
MSEILQTPEVSLAEKMVKLLKDRFPDDEEFCLQNFNDEIDLLGALQGMLIEQGEDPDEIFREYGITEEQKA